MRLNASGDDTHYTLVSYTKGQFNMVNPPPVTRPLNYGTDLSAPSVNKNGQMAATYICPTLSGIIQCAYIISSDGTFTRLPDLGGYSGATSTNDSGDVAGWVCAPGDSPSDCPSQRAVTWPHAGGMTDLSSLTSMPLGLPVAINSKGQVAGDSLVSSSGSGFFYDGAAPLRLFSPTAPPGSALCLSTTAEKSLEAIGHRGAMA